MNKGDRFNESNFELLPATAEIFTTGYPQFALDAFKTHAIGYLLKPIKKEAIIGELENYKKLQQTAFAEDSQKPRFYAKTFGTFEFFVDGQPLKVGRKKSKELLAYMIDRQGAALTRKDFAGAGEILVHTGEKVSSKTAIKNP